MVKKLIILVASSVLALTLSSSARTQGLPVLRELEAADETVRMRGFYKLMAAATETDTVALRLGASLPRTIPLASQAKRNDELALALIRLLERENAVVASRSPESLPEWFLGDYWPDLFVTVARLKDPRAYKALLVVIANGDHIREAIVSAGEQAIPDVVQLMASPDPLIRIGAARTLGKFAARQRELDIGPGHMSAIKTALLGATSDTISSVVRHLAVEALIAFGDDDVRGVMERLATSDDYLMRGLPGREAIYPIRVAASLWLAKYPKRR